MRIVYGVHGYGQGHATRALAVLSDLAARHKVLVLAGGDAYEAMHRDYPVVRIPTLGYCYREGGTRSNWLTFRQNFPVIADLLVQGPAFQAVEGVIRDFEPDVAISDAEPWTHRAALRMGIPRIGFDHFGVLVYCRPGMSWTDRIRAARDNWVYRFLMGQPERVLVSSFYPAPPRRAGVRVVSTLLRKEVLESQASNGEHLLAYLNKGMHLFSKRFERALRELDRPVIVYGTGRLGTVGNLEFRPRGNRAFLEALASCRAVISTAGNQLVGEAIHFEKPLFVVPEDCVEQRINALAVEQAGIGVQCPQRAISAKRIRDFLGREAEFRANLKAAARDGRREALAALEQFLSELTDKQQRSEMTSVA